MQITQNGALYQLAFLPRFFPVNCYLVEEEQELTLIDAAMPFSAKGILQAAQRIGKPITRIVLTHAHGDHVGALDVLKQALPTAKVYISQRDAKLLAGSRALEEGEPNLPIKGDVPKSIRTRPDMLIQDGDRIGSLQAIAAPGHTPGQMAFLDMRSRALVTGDAFQLRGGIAVAGVVKPWFPFPAFATWNKQASLESARKLRELNPSLLAVGHGWMLPNPIAEMDKALEEAERKFRLDLTK
ncbi:MBL fold metallo-hydrolase [Paenibacillus sp. P96]|uniref:MBL fold metallo-hydrolase n=1 Tax=Paenibacillus zeirhizosphaerae TaxID=2987519 RepID=A0ABT9FW88_9BACL|nr:MBL fold metallo-hydrolase [Paenibacillus sp. P96]MDP4098801.1 MBL fold metallo-hydrolase [Paenibacillus sp. P96]